jgi:hypothetical protein
MEQQNPDEQNQENAYDNSFTFGGQSEGGEGEGNDGNATSRANTSKQLCYL